MGVIQNFVSDRQQNVFLNQLLRYVRGNIIVPPAARQPLVTAASSPSAPILLQGPQDATTEIFSTFGFHGAADNADVQARLELELTEVKWRRRWMNRPVLANHFFGNNLQQHQLLETCMLESQSALQLRFTNQSAAGNSNFTFGMRGCKVQQSHLSRPFAEKLLNDYGLRKTFLYPFWFSLDNGFVQIPAASTRTFFMSNTFDIELVLFFAMGSALTTGAAGETTEIFSAQVFDPDDKIPLQSAPFTFNTGFGTARFPYPLPAPLIVEPNRQLEIRITNLVTDQPSDVFLTYAGVANYQGQALSEVDNRGNVVPAGFHVRQL